MKDQDVRPYIVQTYDRWIILVIVLVYVRRAGTEELV